MRILLIEEESRLAEIVRQALREQGYAVDAAGDGEIGFQLALTEPYDLIILDILLPKRDGLSVCRELRRHGLTTPILMLTARDSVEDRVTGLDSGADDYLIKPFALQELLARVRALLRRDSHNKDPLIRLGDLEIDTLHREVRYAGRIIELSTKEYAILLLLAQHPNQVLSRTQIAEHVWDYATMPSSNVVDVYIGYLRRKLGDTPEPRLIETVRGIGYRLRVVRQ
jgi:DNA-binding response OmpR family regulator